MIKINMNKRASECYVGTTSDYKNDPEVKALRESIKGTSNRVVVRGRKPKVKMTTRNFWRGITAVRGYDFGGNVVGGLKNATMFDIYVYKK